MARVSKTGIDLIKEFEGLRLTAYRDEVGVWTIGYGITNSDKAITGMEIRSGMTISKRTAEEWLEESLNRKYLPKVMKYDTRYNWNQNEIDALVSFAYNIGSIDRLTANGTRSKKTIASKILEYNKAGGRVYNGLTRRRKAERELFLTPVKEEVKVAEKKKGCFSPNKNAKGLTEFLHNRGYGAGEHNLRLIAAENYDNLKDAMFTLAKMGELRKPKGLNKRDKK